MGGLGNNLSQLFLAFKLESIGYKVEVNDFLCHKNLVTKFLRWSLHDQSVESLYKNSFKKNKNNLLKIFIDLIFLMVSKHLKRFFGNYLFDSNNLESLSDLSKKNKIILGGYWQKIDIYNENNLIDFKIYLFGDLFSKISKGLNLHIRGGDFIKFKKNINKSYYLSALSSINNSNNIKVFTNDINFSNKILPNTHNYEYSKNNYAKDDFTDMIMSNLLICSNSTFSIWAGLLSNAEKIFIPFVDNKSLKINIDLDSFKNKRIEVIK
jgi:hypothetical protein